MSAFRRECGAGFSRPRWTSMNRQKNDWLAYSIFPGELQTAPYPAMWGNGQLELLADLDRPCVSEAVCFGYGREALHYGPGTGRFGGDQHLVPAVYDAETGRKYLPYSTASSDAKSSKVVFRPDRQVWRYTYDDLTVAVSLILPRLCAGYLMKVELMPGQANTSQRWFVYQELRAFAGLNMWATEADYDLATGMVWCKNSQRKHGVAIGSTGKIAEVNLGLDGGYATDIMVKAVAEAEHGGSPVTVWLGRGFGDTISHARENLDGLLEAPGKLEAETEGWWNRYLDEVPRLETPDEAFDRAVHWSWANFRMNRIDVPVGIAPAGICFSNNCNLKQGAVLSGDNQLQESIQLLHDPQPARDMMLCWLRETRKSGTISPGIRPHGKKAPGDYVSDTSWFCGILHKYLLHTGDRAVLDEDIGGMTVLQRLEEAVDAQLAYREPETGLFRNAEEIDRFAGETPSGKPAGLGSLSEAQLRFRGGAGSYYSSTSATVYGGLLALAEIEELARNRERANRYRKAAEEILQAIRDRFWNEELQLYCDLNPDGSFHDYLGMDAWVTGLCANPVHRPGGAATEEQAARLAEWCNHPDFVTELGPLTLARSNPYFDPKNWKGRNSGFNFYATNQIPAGLYAHGCYEEAHRQLFKQFRRLGENAGLGPRYRGESYNPDTGEILPWRFKNYPSNLHALTSIIEGVFGLRWTRDGLTVHVNAPWPWAKLSRLRIRGRRLDLELTDGGILVATIDGKEVARSEDRKLVLPWETFT